MLQFRPSKFLADYLGEDYEKKAKSLSTPAFHILSDKALDNLATDLPQTKEQLLQVSDIGLAKAEGYGNAILQIISENSDSHEIPQKSANLIIFQESTPQIF